MRTQEFPKTVNDEVNRGRAVVGARCNVLYIKCAPEYDLDLEGEVGGYSSRAAFTGRWDKDVHRTIGTSAVHGE